MDMEDNITITEHVSVKAKVFFSPTHLMSADLFAEKSRQIETAYEETGNQSARDEHMIYSSNAVLASVSFLETNINEFFCDIRDGWHGFKDVISPENLAAMRKMWDLEVPRTASYSIVNKYNIALVLAQKEPFDKGGALYRDVFNIIRLRNALIHYEPEVVDIWDTDVKPLPKSSINHKWERTLKKTFKPSPFYPDGHIYFPQRCIGYGCAIWSLRNAVMFADQFYEKIGMKPSYEHFRDSLVSLRGI